MVQMTSFKADNIELKKMPLSCFKNINFINESIRDISIFRNSKD